MKEREKIIVFLFFKLFLFLRENFTLLHFKVSLGGGYTIWGVGCFCSCLGGHSCVSVLVWGVLFFLALTSLSSLSSPLYPPESPYHPQQYHSCNNVEKNINTSAPTNIIM